jgi:hypothetical protein
MLPNLSGLSLTRGRPIDGTLEDAMNGQDCGICFAPLNADSPQYPWTGTGFWLRQACTNDPGHFFHAGCLKLHVATHTDPVCPDCRAPLLSSILAMRPEVESSDDDEDYYIEQAARELEERDASRPSTGPYALPVSPGQGGLNLQLASSNLLSDRHGGLNSAASTLGRDTGETMTLDQWEETLEAIDFLRNKTTLHQGAEQRRDWDVVWTAVVAQYLLNLAWAVQTGGDGRTRTVIQRVFTRHPANEAGEPDRYAFNDPPPIGHSSYVLQAPWDNGRDLTLRWAYERRDYVVEQDEFYERTELLRPPTGLSRMRQRSSVMSEPDAQRQRIER